jgi:SAM-dependent methyltransferase
MATQSVSNTYSPAWFAAFHVPIREARTAMEVDFISFVASLPEFRRIADLCCGMGRHARALADRGYSVTSVDRDLTALAEARRLGGTPHYVCSDLRDYSPKTAEYDAFVIMGQSFGHFDAATNQAVLSRLAFGLRQHGRFILDVWCSAFFHAHQGEHEFQVPEGTVHEMKRVRNDRLFVHLTYPSGQQEDFDWQLFMPQTMESMARYAGLRLSISCTDFDTSVAPSASKPRIQFVLERV